MIKISKWMFSPSTIKLSPLNMFCNKKQQLSSPPQSPTPTPQTSAKKSYIMPQQKPIDEFLAIERPINYKKGRYLIYMNKQNLLTPFLLGLHFTIPLAYFGYLIVTNPFYLTFPAALPLLFIVQVIIFLLWVKHKALHKRQIERIYLLKSGKQIQIVYANKIRRYMKNNETTTLHLISSFWPKWDKQITQNKIMPYPGVRFPADPYCKLQDAQKPGLLLYGWVFRDNQFNQWVLPAKFDYADWEILTKVLNGIQAIPMHPTGDTQYTYQPLAVQQEEAHLQQYKKGVPEKPQAINRQQNLLVNQEKFYKQDDKEKEQKLVEAKVRSKQQQIKKI